MLSKNREIYLMIQYIQLIRFELIIQYVNAKC